MKAKMRKYTNCYTVCNLCILYGALTAMILHMSTYNDLNSNIPKMVSRVNIFLYEDFICVVLFD